MPVNRSLKNTFNEAALLYDRLRPQYPKELFDTLIKVSHLSNDASLLEIGPGTGQATEPLAKQGYNITAVELGDNLASLAREKFKSYSNVNIITDSFEEVDLPSQSFDLVYSATAFHWVHEDIKFKKSHILLKEEGYLAIIHTNHVADDADNGFFKATQPIYIKYDDERRSRSTKDNKSFRIQRLESLQRDTVDERLFKHIYFGVYPIRRELSSQEYIDLLSTYSSNLAMSKDKREAFLREIKEVIDSQFNGRINKLYAMSLTIAKKK